MPHPIFTTRTTSTVYVVSDTQPTRLYHRPGKIVVLQHGHWCADLVHIVS
jgi:hypothetical protein